MLCPIRSSPLAVCGSRSRLSKSDASQTLACGGTRLWKRNADSRCDTDAYAEGDRIVDKASGTSTRRSQKTNFPIERSIGHNPDNRTVNTALRFSLAITKFFAAAFFTLGEPASRL